jgi:hypothetical protein
MGACAVESLRPQIFVIFAWDSAHPTISPLFNMLSRELYPEDRSVYATSVKAENVIATRDISKMNSISGHVVIRVTEGGGRYQVIVVDDSNELDHVRMRSAILPTKRG